LRLLQLLPLVMKGTHIKERDVSCGRAARLVIDSDRALPIHIDGELFAPYEANVRHVEVEVVPAAVHVLT
jgi:diacylglycerol kinase family enzyme